MMAVFYGFGRCLFGLLFNSLGVDFLASFGLSSLSDLERGWHCVALRSLAAGR